MIRYLARFETPGARDDGTLSVVSPDGRQLAWGSAELNQEISTLCGKQVEPFHLWRGTYDSMTLSLLSKTSIQSICALAGRPLEQERFRANIVVESFDANPYPEDRWIGNLVVCGNRDTSARIRIARKDPRCTIVDLDPATAQRDSLVLQTIVSSRKNHLGVYGSVERPGDIRVGDIACMLKE